MKYLYDTIGSLAYNISKSTAQSENIEPILMEIIAKKWNESQFNTTEDTCLVGNYLHLSSNLPFSFRMY